MEINSNSAFKVIAGLVEKEKALQAEYRKLAERMERAENLKDTMAMMRIEHEGMKFEMKLNMHIASKVTAITMVMNVCPDFQNN